MTSITFNISHHGNWVVLILGSNCYLGVDVLKIELPPSDATNDAFMKWYKDELSDSEWKQVHSADLSSSKVDSKVYNSLNRFLELWCLKESVIKALGIGLLFPLAGISFSFSNKPLSTNMIPWTKTFFDLNNGVIDKSFLNKSGLREGELYNWTFEECYIDSEHCCAIAFRPDYNDSIYVPPTSNNFRHWNPDFLFE